jgi:hypothetical protein
VKTEPYGVFGPGFIIQIFSEYIQYFSEENYGWGFQSAIITQMMAAGMD